MVARPCKPDIVGRINEVTGRWARLVLRRTTVRKCTVFIELYSTKLPWPTQLGYPCVSYQNKYWQWLWPSLWKKWQVLCPCYQDWWHILAQLVKGLDCPLQPAHLADLSPNSITPTFWQSPRQVPNKVADTNHESPRHKSRRRLSWFVSTTSQRLCRELVPDFVANISTCRDGFCLRLPWFVSATFTETSWFHDLSPFVSATFIICVHDFPCGEVSVKVDVMEFGL